jgi:hypothetical protein
VSDVVAEALHPRHDECFGTSVLTGMLAERNESTRRLE